jgi:gamma-glutamyltranspeptidase
VGRKAGRHRPRSALVEGADASVTGGWTALGEWWADDAMMPVHGRGTSVAGPVASDGRWASSGQRFAVATPCSDATQAAAEVFARGGNAVDAAVTASAVLSVVYPHMCGIGGDLIALVVRPGLRSVVNATGAAATELQPDRVRAEHGSMPADGPLSVTVPGAVAAWAVLIERFGRLTLSEALAPAVTLAEEGMTVAGSVARALRRHRDRLRRDPGMRTVMVPDGRVPGEGDSLRQPALAGSLRAIAAEGPEAFYGGPVGRRFIDGLRALGSPLTCEDLRRHTTEVVPPLAQAYRGLDVLVPPPNSQGFVLAEILSCVEQGRVFPDHLGREADVLAQIFAAASADRDQFLADPRCTAVPVDHLLSRSHIQELLVKASPAAGMGAVERGGTGDTVGITAAGEDGLWVSINHSLYDAFGSGILDAATGIIAHNRGSSFSLDPSSPNRLEGGRRPAHTLMPVVVSRGDCPVIASATMGRSAHAQIHAQLLMGVIDQGLSAFEAVSRPRWLVGGLHADEGPRLVMERRVPVSLRAIIARSQPNIVDLSDWDEQAGHAQLIVSDEQGLFDAASDPRADGLAASG